MNQIKIDSDPAGGFVSEINFKVQKKTETKKIFK